MHQLDSGWLISPPAWVLYGAGVVCLIVLSAAVTASPTMVLLSVTGLFLGLVTFVRFPILFLYVIIALIPLGMFQNSGIASKTMAAQNTPTKWLYLPLFALIAWDFIFHRSRLKWSIMHGWVAGFGAVVIVSALLMGDNPYGLSYVRGFMSSIASFYVVSHFINSPRRILIVFLIIIGTNAASTLGGFFGLSASGFETKDALTGMSSVDENTFASFLLIALVWAGAIVVYVRNQIFRLSYLAIAVCLFIGILLTLSRGCYLSLGFVILILLYMSRKKLGPTGLAFIVLLIGIGFLLIPSEYYEVLKSLRNFRSDFSLWRRLSYHLIAPGMIADSPLWGIGPGKFPYRYTFLENRFMTDVFRGPRVMHNLYLNTLVELGLLGLGALGGLIVTTLQTFLKTMRNNIRGCVGQLCLPLGLPLFVSAAGFLFANTFLPASLNDYLWIFFAIAASLQNIMKGGEVAPSH